MNAPECTWIWMGTTRNLDAFLVDLLTQALPPTVQAEANALQQWEDRKASILGKCLLVHGLYRLGRDPRLIYSLIRDENQRPFIRSDFDFNISHSKELVACALQIGGRVGVDVEAMELLNIEDHTLVFTAQERLSILKSTDSLSKFFNLWTRKEAVLKADGRGFLLDPQEIEVQNSKVSIDNSLFTLHPIKLPEPFVGHVATTHTGPIELHWPGIEAILQTVFLLPSSVKLSP